MLAFATSKTRRKICKALLAIDTSTSGNLGGVESFLGRQQQRLLWDKLPAKDSQERPRKGSGEQNASKSDDRKRHFLFGARVPDENKTVAVKESASKPVKHFLFEARVPEPKNLSGKQTPPHGDKPPNAILTLEEINRRLSALDEVMVKVKPLPLSLGEATAAKRDTTAERTVEREEIFVSAKEILKRLQFAVDQGRIKPSGRHGREVSGVLAKILRFYCASWQEGIETSVFEESLRVLNTLEAYNLDRLEAHYHYCILAAVHEKRWKEAAELFLQQIGQETSGPVIRVSKSSPLGLYSIAKAFQGTGGPVVESVMDAATSLTRNSPLDEDQHLLAAGTALGLAGEWEGFLNYIKTSSHAGNLGQVDRLVLIATSMHACILCNEHDRAMHEFRTISGGDTALSSEAYWGGGQDKAYPLCRDLAMRAAAKCGSSDEATAWLNQTLKEELAVSEDALFGVLGACERDSNWSGAVGLLLQLLGGSKSVFAVRGSELEIPRLDDEAVEALTARVDKGRLLSYVMRACNGAQQFGVALLCFMLVDASNDGRLFFKTETASMDASPDGSMEGSMLRMLREVDDCDELLAAAMIALCSVGSFEQAQTLFQLAGDSLGGPSSVEVEQVYRYAAASADSSADQRRWQTAHRHMDRLCKALRAIKLKGDNLNHDQFRILSAALASVLRSCARAGQPDAGIVLCDYAQTELASFASEAAGARDLLLSDSYFAAMLDALRESGQNDLAISLLSSNGGMLEETPKSWTQSTNAALRVLARSGKVEEAIGLFQRHAHSTEGGNIESYVAAARMFAKAQRWSEVADIYHIANENGCLSTPLGLLSLRAVSELSLPGRLRIHRDIVRDTSRAAGTDPVHWLEFRYWKIKRSLGFPQARLLMWWNDPNECRLDEFQFALDVFEKRLAEGIQAKTDVLRLIVSHASQFNGEIPGSETLRTRIPRDRDAWVELLTRVLDESKNLRNNEAFLDQAATALRRLDCHAECVLLVEDAMKRGVRVGEVALNEAHLCEKALGGGLEMQIE